MKGLAGLLWLAGTIAATLIIWLVGSKFAGAISDYEVIQPEPGIKCVVVSRMFNTSVDCWEEKNAITIQ